MADINLLVCDVNTKSALTDRPQTSQLETIRRTKIIYIKALPSYDNNERELCFCKAMVGSDKKTKKHSSAIKCFCFVCYKECTSISHKNVSGYNAITS